MEQTSLQRIFWRIFLFQYFKEKYSSLLPEEISGKDFLTQFKVSIDTITSIDEVSIYKPNVCASHPVYENARVNEFKNLIKNF